MTTMFLAVWMLGGFNGGQQFTSHKTAQEACAALAAVPGDIFKQVYAVSSWHDPDVDDTVSDIFEVSCSTETVKKIA